VTSDSRPARAVLSCAIDLPADFRADDVLAFHRRDPQQLAECVTADTLRKGLAWGGRPACLAIRFHPRRAEAELAIDGAPGEGDRDALARMVRRMLGLTQRVEEFERIYRAHPQLGPLIARHPGLRVPLAASPFEALTWAVTGQQISVGAAVSLRRRLIQAAGLTHSGGLACHPDARHLTRLSEAELRQAGFSQTKARTLLALGAQVEQDSLPLEAWMEALPVEAMREQLLRIRGIGPWTINYALLRGFGWLDGSLHGDVAVRRGLQALLAAPDKISEAHAQRWLAEFSPWRALIAAHLWALQSLPAA
jgi:DNA-3-methyladenine glycosylase II